jgi:hypothetical protein
LWPAMTIERLTTSDFMVPSGEFTRRSQALNSNYA